MSNIIKEELEKYEIKTTSKNILNIVHQKNDAKHKEKKAFFLLLRWGGLLATVSLLLFGFVKLLNNDNNINNSSNPMNTVQLIQDDNKNHVAFQVASGIELLGIIDDTSTDVRAKRNKLNYNEFKEIVDVYDKADGLINNNSFTAIEKEVYQGQFHLSNVTYPYKMIIKHNPEIVVYYDSILEKDGKKEVDTELNGEIHYLDHIYKLYGEKETEKEESEFEITIYKNKNNYIEIEQEIEENDFEYQYKIVKDGKREYEIDYQNEHNKQRLDIKYIDIHYSFKINSSENIISIEYNVKNLNGTIYLEYIENKKVYTESETLEKIYK